jgi:hypothetical protein
MTFILLFEVNFSAAYFCVIASIPFQILIWLLLYSGVPFLLEIFLYVFLAKFVEPSNVFLHLDSFEDFIVLLEHLFLLLLSLLHLHELADLGFLNY